MDTAIITFLSLLVFLPVVGSLVLTLPVFSKENEGLTKLVAFGFTVATFLMSLSLIVGHWFGASFESGQADMQNMFAVSWIPSFDIFYMFGLDGISFPLVILTTFISMLSMAASWNITKHVRAYCILFLLLETGMLGVFLALDFFLFYVYVTPIQPLNSIRIADITVPRARALNILASKPC